MKRRKTSQHLKKNSQKLSQIQIVSGRPNGNIVSHKYARKQKDSAKNAGRNSEVTKSVNTEKVSLNAEKSGADLEDKPSTNPRKRRRSDKENSDTWTIKKSKVSIQISRIHSQS